MIKAAMVLTFFVLMAPQVTFSKQSSNAKYISQELIDTSILRAFTILNASADMAGVGFGHQRSLSEAKKIAQLLKERAKGDPNERYVLWKVGELEAQIYLEERDLVLQQMQKRQLTINELVDRYNTEVGKWRPDFATLYRIHKNMDQVDPGKAGELADSYNKRKNAISREAVYFLEKALLAGNFEEARKELGYCLRNQLYLNVSSSTYKQLEDRVEGLFRAKEAKPLIAAAVVSANRLLDQIDIIEARKTLDSAGNSLSTVKNFLPQNEAASLSASLKRVAGRLGGLEDSLVNVNIAILRSKGIDAADKYLQTVLRPYGVSRDKAASVDRMIISIKSPENNAMHSEISGLEVGDEEESNPALDDVMSAAKKKAQVKMDSLQAIEDARLWKERQRQARQDSIDGIARAAEEVALQKVTVRVDSVSTAVYNLIEKNEMADAERLLRREGAFLERNMRPDDYRLLKNTVEQFTTYALAAKNEIAYLKPIEGKKDTTPTITPKVKANQNRAQEEILGIYTLLEQNEIGRAYKRFLVNKAPLQKYLEPEVYSMLELTVTQAYEYYSSVK
jgi:hypothetical protein